MEDAKHAQRVGPGVLQAMRQAGRQMQAGAWRQRLLATADMRDSGAAQDQHDLVVRMPVLRSPSRRNLADELRRDRATAARAEQDPELPVPRHLDLAVGEVFAA